jgi:hypothetical protein
VLRAPAKPLAFGRGSPLLLGIAAHGMVQVSLMMTSRSTLQTIMTQFAPAPRQGAGRPVPVALASYRCLNAIQAAVSCEASRSVTSRIPSGPTTWNVQGAVSRPMTAWRTRRKMYASASLISAGPGLRKAIIAFSSS